MQEEVGILEPSDRARGRGADADWSEVEKLQREVLRLRDELIGAEAKLGELRARLQAATERDRLSQEVQVASDLTHVMTVNHSLQQQIREIHSSTTWRIGRMVVRPLSVIRRSSAHADGS